MGSVYRRPDSPFWWVWFIGADGKRKAASTGMTDEKKARALLSRLKLQVQAQQEASASGTASGPLTLASFAALWFRRRKASGIASAKNEEGFWKQYLAGHRIAALALSEVKPSHLREFVRELSLRPSKKGGTLSPRTVNHVYGLLRVMFSDALADELIAASPCVLKARRKELPRKRDKDATWRASAVFTRDEVERLISDPTIREDRRVLYACLFLTGQRFGELADRRWSDYDAAAEPLGRLHVGSSFSNLTRASKETKTGVAREVPVHPTLAAVLAAWKLGGWQRMLGRAPTPADWLIPSKTGSRRLVAAALRGFHADCELLGLRERRIHDTRRTFISLALGDGAKPDLLQRVTHDPGGDQFSQYVTPSWSALCQAVSQLRVTLHHEGGVTTMLRQASGTKKPTKSGDLVGSIECGILDSKPYRDAQDVSPRAATSVETGACDDTSRTTYSLDSTERNSVTDDREG